jgi:hypothetical protein
MWVGAGGLARADGVLSDSTEADIAPKAILARF